ncbi:MAG: hypothetical protein Q4A35_03005 [Candidatus Gracilibacteria bacterium]|nr:hypothetical protein [Candidatus Gracilibacteria bacterium]
MVRVYFIHNFKPYAQEIDRIFFYSFHYISASSISVSAQEQGTSKVALKLVHEKFGIEVATKELGVTGGLYGKVQGWFE